MNVKVYKVNNWVIHLAVKEKKKKKQQNLYTLSTSQSVQK